MRFSTAHIYSPPADKKLHAALDNINLKDRNSVDAAIVAINDALKAGADINSTRKSNFGSLLTGEPSQLTILQHAALLSRDIGDNQQGQGRKLLRLIKHLVNSGANVQTQPLLDLLLPALDPGGRYSDNYDTGRNEIICFLFQKGAYKIDRANAKAATKDFPQHTTLQDVLSKILFVNDVRDNIIGPLATESGRLEGKPFQASLSTDEYEGRQKVVSGAIDALEIELQTLHEGSTIKTCQEGLKKAIKTHLVDQSASLDKYKDLEQLGRGLLNALFTIATGVIPGLLLYAITGHSFLSTKGKTKDVAQKVCNNAEVIFDTKFTL